MGFTIRTFIYPYFEWNDAIVTYVKEAGYDCARSGWPESKALNLTTVDSDRYHVPSYAITQENIDEFKYIVNQAGSHSVICLTYHHISDTAPQETSTPTSNFSEQLRYLKENQFNVVFLPDCMSRYYIETE